MGLEAATQKASQHQPMKFAAEQSNTVPVPLSILHVESHYTMAFAVMHQQISSKVPVMS